MFGINVNLERYMKNSGAMPSIVWIKQNLQTKQIAMHHTKFTLLLLFKYVFSEEERFGFNPNLSGAIINNILYVLRVRMQIKPIVLVIRKHVDLIIYL